MMNYCLNYISRRLLITGAKQIKKYRWIVAIFLRLPCPAERKP